MAIVGENMFTNVLSLQDMKHLSLPGFNKAFDDTIKIINNNVQNNTYFMSVHLSYPDGILLLYRMLGSGRIW